MDVSQQNLDTNQILTCIWNCSKFITWKCVFLSEFVFWYSRGRPTWSNRSVFKHLPQLSCSVTVVCIFHKNRSEFRIGLIAINQFVLGTLSWRRWHIPMRVCYLCLSYFCLCLCLCLCLEICGGWFFFGLLNVDTSTLCMGESDNNWRHEHEQDLPSRAKGSPRTRSDHGRDSLV